MSLTLRGVTFPAWRGDGDFVPRIELLLATGPWTLGPVGWVIGDCEFGTGRRGSAELARLARTGTRVSTRVLVDPASDGVQLVDGDVACFDDWCARLVAARVGSLVDAGHGCLGPGGLQRAGGASDSR